MRILLTNDDGINAMGLRALHRALTQAGHDVLTVAPASEQSGVSSAMTLHTPLRFHHVIEDDFTGYAVGGTPVDCVKLAIHELCTERPDLVISGINAGNNAGVDVFYSGTVGAAMEAAFLNYPSLAVSRRPFAGDDPAGYAEQTAALVARIPWASLPPHRVLNLNFPPCPPARVRGLRLCGLSMVMWRTHYEERKDPRNRSYWWLADVMPAPEAETAGSDFALLAQHYATLTPLQLDLTDHALMRQLEEFQW